jgi:hypothetical protein
MFWDLLEGRSDKQAQTKQIAITWKSNIKQPLQVYLAQPQAKLTHADIVSDDGGGTVRWYPRMAN